MITQQICLTILLNIDSDVTLCKNKQKCNKELENGCTSGAIKYKIKNECIKLKITSLICTCVVTSFFTKFCNWSQIKFGRKI